MSDYKNMCLQLKIIWTILSPVIFLDLHNKVWKCIFPVKVVAYEFDF